MLSIEPLLEDLGPVELSGIGWVILGGESGPGARPMERDWVRSIRDQCRAASVPFFFKQWGGVRKNKSGRELDGRTHDEVPVRLDRQARTGFRIGGRGVWFTSSLTTSLPVSRARRFSQKWSSIWSTGRLKSGQASS